MSSPQLENLIKIGSLKAESSDKREFDGLMRSALNRLVDAQRSELSLESRFDLAYNAAHALSLAALRWHGCRSDNRYLVFQCLQHTVGLAQAKWRVLDQCHRLRNLAEYEGVCDISENEINGLLAITGELVGLVKRLAAGS
jgi:hypothetical protein